LTLDCNDIDLFYEKFKANGINFNQAVQSEFWGKYTTFSDLYGNTWCLSESNESKTIHPEVKWTMLVYLAYIAKDMDEAKDWYVSKLGFDVEQDKFYEKNNFRWLTIAPAKGGLPAFSLTKADDEEKLKRVGTQNFLMDTDNIQSFYEKAVNNGVEFHLKPTHNYGGIDAQFKDLYGNSWNVREHSKDFNYQKK